MTPDLRFLERIRSIDDLNRLTLFVGDNSPKGSGGVHYQRARDYLSYESEGGVPIPFDEIVQLARGTQLVELSKGKLRLTPLGVKFCSLNPRRTVELTDEQRSLLSESIILARTPVSKAFTRLIRGFSYRRDAKRYEMDITGGNSVPNELGVMFLCSSVGIILQEVDSRVFISPSYNPAVQRIIRCLRTADWADREPSDEDIERARHSERLVFDAEVERLTSSGHPKLSARVDLVSEYDASAGYDIESYDGDSSVEGVPDRFIEVKASTGTALRFYLSGHEMDTARERGASYRVIFLGAHDIGRTLSQCHVREIIDPAAELMNRRKYRLNAQKFLVTAV